jgi:hypothetical protein
VGERAAARTGGAGWRGGFLTLPIRVKRPNGWETVSQRQERSAGVSPVAANLIRVSLVGDDARTAYIALPGYPENVVPGVVSRTLNLTDLVKGYVGPRVHLDFNVEGVLIGIEVLVFGQTVVEPDDLSEN